MWLNSVDKYDDLDLLRIVLMVRKVIVVDSWIC
jgi:hypothetical protein